jgi:hypothetical protein
MNASPKSLKWEKYSTKQANINFCWEEEEKEGEGDIFSMFFILS